MWKGVKGAERRFSRGDVQKQVKNLKRHKEEKDKKKKENIVIFFLKKRMKNRSQQKVMDGSML